jgi:hypothetical protein
VASNRTRLSELGTAVGLVAPADGRWPDDLASLTVPGLSSEVWQPAVLPVARGPAGAERDLLLRAVDNGRAFRRSVLRGRAPASVEWTGGSRATWTSDVPRDITIDGVWFIQAKHDSTCVLNTSPASLVDTLLAEDGVTRRTSWYQEVALLELQAYWRQARTALIAGREILAAEPEAQDLPADVRDLQPSQVKQLAPALAEVADRPEVVEAYRALARAVSVETTLRWQQRLRAASDALRTQMLFRMLRIAGGPYWVLGAKGSEPVRLAVADTLSWRRRHRLHGFEVVASRAGQPQVDWWAEIYDGGADELRRVEGRCELRWSHGKLRGNPECKVQVSTPLDAIPGYAPLG